MPEATTDKTIQKSVAIAQQLQESRKKAKSNPFAERMGPIINSPESKFFLIRLMDVAFRSSNYDRISTFVVRLFNSTASHRQLFNTYEKSMVRLFRMVGYKLPSVSIPLMLDQIQDVTSPILFFVGDKKFKEHAKKRKKEGIQLNVNLIGEALIGEEEASERIRQYCELLNQPEIDYISIKISTIYSQINSLAHDYGVKILVEKLSYIYDTALRLEQETGKAKFVNLDMEEYRDLSMTIDTFMRTLSNAKYKHLRAGIVLQAYLPDSYNEMLKLQKWAKERVANGGAPIKIRVVKGANLEMEKTEASLEEWPQAPYHEKIQADANFKKILLALLTKESAPAVNVGVASHNIFDLAFALNIVKEQKLEKYIDFEMLEGMGDATVQELLRQNVKVILYTPIVREEDYTNAIAYLVRRLDEGTQEGNFLREGFNLKPNTPKWEELKEQFLKSVDLIETVPSTQYRTQNRAAETYEPQTEFKNVPNTDWTLKANRDWIEGVKERWNKPTEIVGEVVPVVGELEDKKREVIDLTGWNGTQPWKYELADAEDYEKVIGSSSEWYDYPLEKRVKLLKDAAVEIAKVRGDLIGVAITELGKTAPEVDVEVSEAIDFANYYAQSILTLTQDDKIELEDGGINLVLSPWNFPIAIPIGGALASLAAGKRVILKPSQNAAACSYLICQCLWKAGIPKSALSFLPAHESSLDPFLSEGNVFDAVILTGGTATAKFLLDRNPRLKLYAETGGKNATIVTSLADRDQAIKNVVQSAFGNTGQKCSATSLLILENELFENKHFKNLLRDAVQSKIKGNPWNFETQVGPLAVPISDKLRTSIETTPDEQWLVKPVLEGTFMLSPGVKWGVTKDDFEYQNELFGPILSVMKADGLKDAIDLVNGVEYGLTSGIETLAREEMRYWLNNVKAGNLYANRSTTGAIVQRQPFGGMKASSFGLGMKAGGSNYVLQFANTKTKAVKLDTLEKDYRKWYRGFFSREIDYVKLRGQHNISRYLTPDKVLVLIDEKTTDQDILKVDTICSTMRVKVEFYALKDRTIPASSQPTILKSWDELAPELDYDVVVRALNYDRLNDDFLRMCHEKAIHVYGRKPSHSGRIEFLNYLTEQSMSINYHRYGNLLGEEPV